MIVRMWRDPIVEKVHRTRQRLFAECDNDLNKLVALLREQQVAEGRNVVSFPPRRPRNELGDQAPDTGTPPPSTN